MNYAIILASGQGKRFGGLKQFLMLRNKPVILYSLEKFEASNDVNQILIVTLKSKISYLEELINQHRLHKVSAIITGGLERQDSVNNALKILPDKGYVAIHDAARPLLTQTIITRGFRLVRKYPACIPVVPIYDTVKEVKDGWVQKTLDRSSLYSVQTPQFFELGLLKKAYEHAYKKNLYQNDDAGIIELLGYPVYTFLGDKVNIKITDQKDLELLKCLCAKE
jgi:2-C-methyl-D-erythritol 4-phosphate cytidylyltransferase